MKGRGNVMNKKMLRFTAVLTALLLCLPFLGPVKALAASEEKEFNKWDTLEAAYMRSPYNSVEARIYAEGPDLEGTSEAKGLIRSMFLVLVSDDGYALYADKSTGELVCLKLSRDAAGKFSKHPDYADKPILDLNGKEAYIMDYTGYWSTNPYTIGAINASTNIKAQLYSQINIEFTENAQSSTYYSFIESALLDQIKISSIKNGARVEYTVGQEAVKYLAPRFITASKYKALLAEVTAGLAAEYGDEESALFYAEKFDSYYREVSKTSTSDADYIKESIKKFGPCYQTDIKI